MLEIEGNLIRHFNLQFIHNILYIYEECQAFCNYILFEIFIILILILIQKVLHCISHMFWSIKILQIKQP